jgi:hypothetical protein
MLKDWKAKQIKKLSVQVNRIAKIDKDLQE